MRTVLRLAAGALLAGLTASTGAHAADVLAVERGKLLAETWCASCHLVGTDNQATAMADVAPFASLAERSTFDAGTLAIALFNPHPAMPKLDLSRDDIRALAEYIGSLRSGDMSDAGATDATLATGRAIAEGACGECHALEGDGPSPRADAPVFSHFARQWPVESLAEAFAEGIVVSHTDVGMPEFELDPPDIDALLAFIESVQR